jgi:hypothetical protein
MLKWTCRFRDMLERRGFDVSIARPYPLRKIREAEFDDGSFPDSFRWDTLRGCLCDGASTSLLIDPSHASGLVPPICLYLNDRQEREAQSIRQLCGSPVAYFDRQDIDVLWLSPTVFISTMDFQLPLPGGTGYPKQAHDYAVRLTRENGESFLYHAYSLSLFEGHGFAAPSPLPMKLLRHVAANLEAGYFNLLELGPNFERRDEPLLVECLLHFVAIVPCTPMSPSEQTDVIHLKIHTKMNQDDLQKIYSHRFHPSVELTFSGTGLTHPFDESVPLSVFLELTRQCQHLRTVNLPRHFFSTEHMHPKHRIVVDAMFKCPRITLHSIGTPNCCWRKFSHVMLHQIALGLGSNEIRITVDHSRRRGDYLHLCIQPFLREDSILERFVIELLTDVNDSSPRTITQCHSRSLCYFDVSLAPAKGKRTSAHLESWDKVLFPRLSLNYCRKHVTQRVCGGAIPLAIKAVNSGNVYSKTTGQIPFDMSTANAGLIFRFLKCEVDTLHGSDACPRFSPLSGKKRPAPS